MTLTRRLAAALLLVAVAAVGFGGQPADAADGTKSILVQKPCPVFQKLYVGCEVLGPPP
jgi:hypothetical protein